jgi:hypothetical protein
LNDAGGHKISGADFNASVYANIPRLLWITDAQILGGNIGVDALLPLPYTHMEANTPGGRFDDSSFGIGDVFAEVTWSAHTKQFDFALGAGFWAPSGDFEATNPTEPGKGYWTPMFTAGLTWYVDSEKKWAVSALSRWEINTEQEDTDIRPGTAYTLEWGISRALSQTVDLGVVGYYQTQVNEDEGAGASSAQDSVAGIGPEVSVFYPKSTFGWSLRYLYEFMAQDRPQGHTFVLTMTKRF